MSAVEIPLDECELEMALAVGRWRRLRALRERLGRGHGEQAYDWNRDMTGAIAELAVAKALGCYWGGLSTDFGRAGDVAGLEIRATTHRTGHLVVYMADPPDRQLVLVIVGPRSALIAGWLPAFSGREARFLPPQGRLRPGSPQQWWIPQQHLRPFDTLQLEQTA
jgi:hypothetical protein